MTGPLVVTTRTVGPPPFTLPGPIPFFSLGSFQHQNFQVDDPSLTSVLLDVILVINVDGVPRPPLTFTFTFNHEETPNNQMPCPYPTPPGEGCTDRVTIVASPTPTTFNVDGIDYTLQMSFLNNGNPVSEFITTTIPGCLQTTYRRCCAGSNETIAFC